MTTPMEILFAILSAMLFGLVTVVDKRLISKVMPNFNSFCFAVGISLTSFSLITVLIFKVNFNFDIYLLSAVFSGFCWGGSLGVMFYAYRIEEASRVTALTHTFPVLVAILAVIFLKESLSFLQVTAICVVVVGAYVTSIQNPSRGNFFKLNKALPILIFSSLLLAVAHITSKYALEGQPLPSVYVYRNIGMAVALFSLCKPRHAKDLFVTLIKDRGSLCLILLSEFLLAPVAVILNVVATSMGPVTIVSTVTASRPLFVFIFVTIFSIPSIGFLDEKLDRRVLTVKALAIAGITSGIVLLSI
ncbi:MAG TPA: hypothetical protein DEZ08_06865 [Dehalococcoidia bacterium]|nr:hypothetical protein [Dehalococcoidia bacterium]